MVAKRKKHLQHGCSHYICWFLTGYMLDGPLLVVLESHNPQMTLGPQRNNLYTSFILTLALTTELLSPQETLLDCISKMLGNITKLNKKLEMDEWKE